MVNYAERYPALPRLVLFMFEQRAIILPLPMSQQSGPDDSAADLLDPYEKLISLEIMGNEVSVPEKNRLLRCFQFYQSTRSHMATFAGTASVLTARFGIT